jgi:hypothetical protein
MKDVVKRALHLGEVGHRGPNRNQLCTQPPLSDSDALIRTLTKELSADPRLDSWMQTKDIIRKFVAAVDAIAEGRSPLKQIDFFAPQGKFQVLKKGYHRCM